MVIGNDDEVADHLAPAGHVHLGHLALTNDAAGQSQDRVRPHVAVDMHGADGRELAAPVPAKGLARQQVLDAQRMEQRGFRGIAGKRLVGYVANKGLRPKLLVELLDIGIERRVVRRHAAIVLYERIVERRPVAVELLGAPERRVIVPKPVKCGNGVGVLCRLQRAGHI